MEKTLKTPNLEPLEAMPGSAGRALFPIGACGRRSPACLSSFVRREYGAFRSLEVVEGHERAFGARPRVTAAVVGGRHRVSASAFGRGGEWLGFAVPVR
jgi:hypothetical protein